MEVGFSGTRKGMTPEQVSALSRFLLRAVSKASNNHEEVWFNHGDCVGSDAEAHEIAQKAGCKIRVHPPADNKLRAFCELTSKDELEQPQIYSIRNRNIVRRSSVVIATPRNDTNIPRGSGTWQVIRMCQFAKKPHVIVHPNGRQVGDYKWEKFLLRSQS